MRVVIIKSKYKLILLISGVIIIITIILVFLRGEEDGWIKDSNGNWVKHGNPAVFDFDSCANSPC